MPSREDLDLVDTIPVDPRPRHVVETWTTKDDLGDLVVETSCRWSALRVRFGDVHARDHTAFDDAMVLVQAVYQHITRCSNKRSPDVRSHGVSAEVLAFVETHGHVSPPLAGYRSGVEEN